MRIGAPVFNYAGPEEWAMRHVERGYGAAYFPLNSASADGEIEAHAIGWTLDRISRVDLCILRVALCEMKHMALPPAVAINEALELARA